MIMSPPAVKRRSTFVVITSVFFVAFTLDRGCHQLTMLSKGRAMVVGVDERVSLDCRFEAQIFNLFDYPVLWRKTQAVEETQINIMGNINEPFINTNRYEVTFDQTGPPRYNLELIITDIFNEDSGNYTCEVRGPQSVVLGVVTHFLYVKAGVESVVISDDEFIVEHHHHNHNNNNNIRASSNVVGQQQQYETNRVIHLVENLPSTIGCIAFGGYPPPSLLFYLGQDELTNDAFLLTSRPSLTGDNRGLKRIRYRSEMWTYAYKASSEDDGMKLTCIATVADMKSITDVVHISVDYAPKISCSNNFEAYFEERNVNVRCEIKAKPSLNRIFWVVDSNGTTLATPSDSNDDFQLQIRWLDGSVETQLTVRKAKSEMFRNYSIVANNSVSVVTKEITLNRKDKDYRLKALPSSSVNHGLKSPSGGGNREHENRRTSSSRAVKSRSSSSSSSLSSLRCIVYLSLCLPASVVIVTVRSYFFSLFQ